MMALSGGPIYSDIFSNQCRLYHINPWTDTTQGVCSSFSFFRADPDTFFASRFAGMTPTVARFLAERVFCILDDPMDTMGKRVSARDFGRWVRNLPDLLGQEIPVLPVPLALAQVHAQSLSRTASRDRSRPQSRSQSRMRSHSQLQYKAQAVALSQALSDASFAQGLVPAPSPIITHLQLQQISELQQGERCQAPPSPAWRHKRGLSNASIGFSLSSVPQSRRPSSRQASFSESATPTAPCSRAATPLLRGRGLPPSLGPMSLSRAPSTSREPVLSELPTVFDQDVEEDMEGDLTLVQEHDQEQQDHEVGAVANGEDEGMDSRTPSVVRKRKRGARRGKGHQQAQQQATAPPTSAPPASLDTLESLATASQALARELSRTSRSQSSTSHRPGASTGAIVVPLSAAASITHLSPQLLRTVHGHAHGQNDVPKRAINGVFDWAAAGGGSGGSLSSSSVNGEDASFASLGAAAAVASSVSTSSAASAATLVNGIPSSAQVPGSDATSIPVAPPIEPPSSTPVEAPKPTPVIQKKTSKWKLTFGRSNSNNTSRPGTAMASSDSLAVKGTSSNESQSKQQQTISPMANSVTSVVMGLNSTHTQKVANASASTKKQNLSGGDVSASTSSSGRSGDQWPRGRRDRASPLGVSSNGSSSSSIENWAHGVRHQNGSTTAFDNKRAHGERNPSPTSTRNGRFANTNSGASSKSNNWRNSTISTNSSVSSAFTRYSNSSVRSVSTVATSVSAGSWRNQSTTSLSSSNCGSKQGSLHSSGSASSRHSDAVPKMPPPNVKCECYPLYRSVCVIGSNESFLQS